jgi:hypothetical protein
MHSSNAAAGVAAALQRCSLLAVMLSLALKLKSHVSGSSNNGSGSGSGSTCF